jgi:hypothetical protein
MDNLKSIVVVSSRLSKMPLLAEICPIRSSQLGGPKDPAPTQAWSARFFSALSRLKSDAELFEKKMEAPRERKN